MSLEEMLTSLEEILSPYSRTCSSGFFISAYQKAGATFLIMAADTVCCKPNNASNAISANVLFII